MVSGGPNGDGKKRRAKTGSGGFVSASGQSGGSSQENSAAGGADRAGSKMGVDRLSVGGLPGGYGDRVQRFSFNISSDFLQARHVQQALIEAVTSRGFSENDLFAIKLALEEAMINAIKHGNRLDPAKHVQVEAIVGEDALEIVIQDQGAGFRREDIPDPTLEENLEKCSGRGILLIEAYMSSAEWTDGGRCLRMSKRREPQLVPKVG